MKNLSTDKPEHPKSVCPICSKTSESIIANKLRRGEGRVAYCKECCHGFLIKTKKIDLEDYYNKEYRKEYSHNSEKTSTNATELFDIYKNYQKQRLDFILPHIKKNDSFIEIGASAGQFLIHIKPLLSDVNAIELDLDCFDFLTKELGINADSKKLEQSKFGLKKFDIICCFQVLEHVENPIEFIKNLKNISKKGSKIFIEVPNIQDPLLSVWNIESYKTFFYHSAHIHYFSETSLNKIIDKAGFNINKVQYNYSQDYNLLNHLNWILNDSPQKNCKIGLSEINLIGKKPYINDWLSEELTLLNKKYNQKLAEHKVTSNIMLMIDCDE